ncbi:hypothetical protein DKX38_004500 [Salix brachista]|uniref:Inhibitor I9 domain-containing protein n=1 Tax=Salix brachista TaxID=2182728 RepID=A0A5N5NDK3_9ROSI|nr:hypothetical protein DKX38_004500 [Salix brachista]
MRTTLSIDTIASLATASPQPPPTKITRFTLSTWESAAREILRRHRPTTRCWRASWEGIGKFSECSSESAIKSLVYSYGRSFNGFAARLSDEEVEKLSGELSNEWSLDLGFY